MQKILLASPVGRRLLPALAVAALLAALLLINAPALRGVAASPKALPVLTLCHSASIDVSPLDPQQPGTPVKLSAAATGCTSPVFRYLLLAPGSTTWVFKTAYTATPYYYWDTRGAKLGVWQIGIWAKESASTTKYNAWSISTFTIGGVPYCTAAHVSTNPVSPQIAGTAETINSATSGCPTPFVEFWMLAPGSTTWTLVRPWMDPAVGGTFAWDTTSLAPGAYRWAVWAKQYGSTHKYDVYGIYTFWLT